MYIHGIDNLSVEEVERSLQAGGRFVYFECCVSFILVTLWRPSSIYFLPARTSALLRSLPYAVATILLGWWGIPWGPVYTVRALAVTLTGGRDVTAEVQAFLHEVLKNPQAETTGNC
jgi:hypothetical protein